MTNESSKNKEKIPENKNFFTDGQPLGNESVLLLHDSHSYMSVCGVVSIYGRMIRVSPYNDISTKFEKSCSRQSWYASFDSLDHTVLFVVVHPGSWK